MSHPPGILVPASCASTTLVGMKVDRLPIVNDNVSHNTVALMSCDPLSRLTNDRRVSRGGQMPG
jgi:hypothetical protein